MFGWNVYFLINLWILLTERLISTCIIVSDDAFGFLFAFFFLILKICHPTNNLKYMKIQKRSHIAKKYKDTSNFKQRNQEFKSSNAL